MFQEVDPATQPTLIGRWALNEASGPSATGSARPIPGTLMPVATPPIWTAGLSVYPADGRPAAPQGLTADPGNARVSLTWTGNTETDFAGYNVIAA